LLILALLAGAVLAMAADDAGFPTGKWLLDKAGSQAVAAKSQILEIIKDDGKTLSFSIHQIESDGSASLLKWNGDYGAEPRPVEGRTITFAVAHGPDGSILISGHQPDGGRFQEVCRVAPNKRHFHCDGTKWARDGEQSTYLEVYDLVQ
jgi:hypothetical protein